MPQEPDFFLTCAGENESLAEPRACWRKRHLKDDTRDDYLVVKIRPPVVGQPYGKGADDIHDLVLSTRYEGFSLFSVSTWPCPVYVSRVLDDAILERGVFRRSEIELIAWGTIFPDLESATRFREQHNRI
jgi:hypothetical protein